MYEENIRNLLDQRFQEAEDLTMQKILSRKTIKNKNLGIPNKENCYKSTSKNKKSQIEAVIFFYQILFTGLTRIWILIKWKFGNVIIGE